MLIRIVRNAFATGALFLWMAGLHAATQDQVGKAAVLSAWGAW